jgi:L,D-peptidoglycan transpeptidase YkuD (ErfK/YbiS/YcfS/YnhG family)
MDMRGSAILVHLVRWALASPGGVSAGGHRGRRQTKANGAPNTPGGALTESRVFGKRSEGTTERDYRQVTRYITPGGQNCDAVPVPQPNTPHPKAKTVESSRW